MKAILTKLLKLLKKTGSLLFPLILLGVFLIGWWIGRPATTKSSSAAESGDSGTIWTCSMHPTIRQPSPGLCPICEMDLIEVSASGAGGLRELHLSNNTVANLGIRVAPVVRQPLEKSLGLLGRVVADETSLKSTTARMNGRLDRLFVDYTGATVLKGQTIAEIYSPDLLVAQQELISAKRNLTRSKTRASEALYRGAREKLRLLQLTTPQIDEIEKREQPTDRISLQAPLDGVVMHLAKREGDYVKTGDPLYTLADLSQVWVQLEAYETDLIWLEKGQRVELRTESLPGEIFAGQIAFIDPVLNEKRRITRVRVEVANPLRLLKLGMFATAIVQATPSHLTAAIPLQIPASAVLQTGQRAVVYRRISSDEGVRFEGREIVLGPRAGDYFVVLSGVEEGDLVVTRGAFKLDSELQIQAKPAMMLDGQSTGEGPALSAPETIVGAWKPVLRSLKRAENTRMNSAEFSQHLANSKTLLDSINPDFLADDYQPLWEEAKMRLGNLFVQAALVAKSDSVERAWQFLLRELPPRSSLAGLPWQLPSLKTLPESRIIQLNAALETYLKVSSSLAHDKPEVALEEVASLINAVQPLGNEFAAAAAALRQASNESTLRMALNKVTASLVEEITTDAADQLGELYLVHCPMAFDNAGGDWLSREPIVENPYFGSRMFSCGDVVETLSIPLEDLNSMKK